MPAIQHWGCEQGGDEAQGQPRSYYEEKEKKKKKIRKKK